MNDKEAIRMTIDFIDEGGGKITLNISTLPFDINRLHASVGILWAGMCAQLNDYFRARGMPGFDCMGTAPPAAFGEPVGGKH